MHAPGTLLSDRFNGDWDTYLERIELSEPRIEALGVTDYFCIRTYQQVREWKEKNRLENVHLIFPNVEIRMNIETGKGSAINLHLLFSPEDPDHELEIIRALGQLDFEFGSRNFSCTESDLVALGRAFTGRVGWNMKRRFVQVPTSSKFPCRSLKKLFRAERWMQENCLVAVAGSSNDGTAGLAKDASFTAIRQEIERFAHIIFASTPKQRDFWLGSCSRGVRRLYREDVRFEKTLSTRLMTRTKRNAWEPQSLTAIAGSKAILPSRPFVK